MLVARREPPFYADPHDAGPVNPSVYATPKASKLARLVTIIQMVGSLLAVPIGIASAYSFYRANFSAETTCQNLRSGIVAMLDKSVDAATRRILVRRDVEAFEKTCGTVDPDATAAFKTLLDVDKTAARAPAASTPAPAIPKVQHVEPAPKEPVRKAEPRPQTIEKQPAASVATIDAEPARRDPAVSDAQWLDAVRQALVTHKPEASVAKAPSAVEPVVRPLPHEAALPAPAVSPQAPAIAPAAPVAPVLPPPIAIAPTPAQQVDADHPVPPGSSPDSMPPPGNADAAKPSEHGPSRIRKWISEIPLLGPAVEDGRQ